jgi:hypothetical protein
MLLKDPREMAPEERQFHILAFKEAIENLQKRVEIESRKCASYQILIEIDPDGVSTPLNTVLRDEASLNMDGLKRQIESQKIQLQYLERASSPILNLGSIGSTFGGGKL